jgi:hypothetical protein
MAPGHTVCVVSRVVIISKHAFFSYVHPLHKLAGIGIPQQIKRLGCWKSNFRCI